MSKLTVEIETKNQNSKFEKSKFEKSKLKRGKENEKVKPTCKNNKK